MRILLAESQVLMCEGLKRVALDIDATNEFVEAADAPAARIAWRSEPLLDAVLFDDALFAPDELSTWCEASIRSFCPSGLSLRDWEVQPNHNLSGAQPIPTPSEWALGWLSR